MRRVAVRIVPFLMVCYFISFLDRVNLGFAALQMVRDLHFSATVFGLGGGIFFVSYFLFEVPSNLLLEKVGARRWIARIMITWGLLAAGMALVTGPAFVVSDAVSPRGGRSGILSGRDSLSHLLVSLRIPCAHHRVVHGRHPPLQLSRLADLGGPSRRRRMARRSADGSGCSSSRRCRPCCSDSPAWWS